MHIDGTKIRKAAFNKQGTIDCEYNHPDLGWIPFTADPSDSEELGRAVHKHLIDNDLVGPYVAIPTINDAVLAEATLGDWVEQFTAPISAGVSQEERLSWPVKNDAAKAHIAGTPSASQTQMLTLEANWTGETIDALAGRIVAKADQYSAIVAAIAGIRRKASVAFQNADAVADPFAYDKALLVAKNEMRNHMWITFGLQIPDVL